ncbi:MAG: hypothetical protein HOW73_19555 [Polyangiaceae bacterium]|nr:hypothetical protein [Polyangiaceae bacterium]
MRASDLPVEQLARLAIDFLRGDLLMSSLSNGVLLVVVGAVAIASSVGVAGCESEPAYLTLRGEEEVLPGFSYSTGLQPPGSPVQASFDLSAGGTTVVEVKTQPSGSASAPELIGIRGGGTLSLQGGFAMTGTLKIDIDGLPSYDGPIPGIENVNIAFEGKTTFDPFSIGKPQSAKADIPPARLPPIPLPGGIPGSLVLDVAEGSFIEVGFTGSCAGIEGDTASYEGDLTRGGALVIKPSVEVDVPIIGKQVFEIPSFTVDLVLDAGTISASAAVTEYGGAVEGEKADVACSGMGEGGGNTGGGNIGGGDAGGGTDVGGGGEGGSSGTGGGTPCTQDSDCDAGEGCNLASVCSPISIGCFDTTVVLDSLLLDGPGDTEFGGNGPNVTIEVYPYVEVEGVTGIGFQVIMEETQPDYSMGYATLLGELAPGMKVHNDYVIRSYTDTDTNVDTMSVGPDALSHFVRQIRCMGDTPGEDICEGCSYCEIDLGCLALTWSE